MADFDLFKVKVIDRCFSFLEKGLTLTKRRRMTYCVSKSVQPFWLHPRSKSVISFLKNKEKKKKRTNPYMLDISISVPENFSENKFA